MGSFIHNCEGDLVCRSIHPQNKIPYFNAPIFLENKTQIGKVDEILGPINQTWFTVKPQDGIQATSFKQGDKVFIGGDKLLPLEKFMPKAKAAPGTKSGKRGLQGKVEKRGGGRGGAGRGGFSRGGAGRGGGFSRGRGGPGRGGPGRGGAGRGGGFSRGRGRGGY